MRNPVAAIGLLHRGMPTEKRFLGTCFAYRRGTRFLTAAHCVQDIPPDELWLTAPQTGLSIGAGLEVRVHPNIDLAVILRPGLMIVGNEVEPFDSLEMPRFGEDVWAFGFPADPLGAGRQEPKERLFKGHVQRVMSEYSSPVFQGTYFAVELSFTSPAGLSGGPIFRPGPPWVLLGVVTENMESKTYLEEIEEEKANGMITRTRYQRVVSYGVAAAIAPAGDWLERMAPPPVGSNPNATITGDALPEH